MVLATGLEGLPVRTTESVVEVIGLALLIVDGGIFGYFALRNAVENPFEGQRAFWRYLLAIGLSAVLFGLAGLASIFASSQLLTAFGDSPSSS